MKNYYQILGLNRDADLFEIKKAYKKLAIKFHPDKNNNDSFFEERFKEILEAYETLSDIERKKAYDSKYDILYNNGNTKHQSNKGTNKDSRSKYKTSSNNRDTKKKTRKNYLGYIIALLIFFTIKHFFFDLNSDNNNQYTKSDSHYNNLQKKDYSNSIYLNQDLVSMTNEINKTCPIYIDQDTKLENVTILPDNMVRYNITLLNILAKDINKQEFDDFMKPLILNNIKKSSDMDGFRDYNVTIVYQYKDERGNLISKITIYSGTY